MLAYEGSTGERIRDLLFNNESLSSFYFVSVLLTLIAVLVSWLANDKKVASVVSSANATPPEESNATASPTPLIPPSANTQKAPKSPKPSSDDQKLSQVQKKLLLREMMANMSEEQRAEEKNVVRAQLNAIMQLMRKQEEKFNVKSVKELEDQLKLYK